MKRFVKSQLYEMPENETLLRLCRKVNITNLSDAAMIYLDTGKIRSGNFLLKLGPCENDDTMKRLIAKAVIHNLLTIFPDFAVQIGTQTRFMFWQIPLYVDFNQVWNSGSYQEDVDQCLNLVDQYLLSR